MDYRLPRIEDKDEILSYIEEHYSHNEKNLSASVGLLNCVFEEWVEKINNNVNVTDEIWGKSFTYLVFNGLVYSVDALTFLRAIGFSAFIMYFLVMFIFVSAMSKRFNKRIFRFTVRESVRGDDDND